MPQRPNLATTAPPAGTVLSLQQRRLRQILWAIILALSIVTLLSFSRGATISVAVEIMAIGLLFQAFRWNERGQLAHATALMVTTLMVVLCALMAVSEGLFDEAVMAFPALLVFASMYGSRRLFILLMGCMLAVLVALAHCTRPGCCAVSQTPSTWRARSFWPPYWP